MKDLNDLRQEIDRLDRSIIEAFKARFLVVREIGQIKNKQNLPPLDEARWNKVLETRLSWAEELGVGKDFIRKVWDLIHSQSLEIEDNEK